MIAIDWEAYGERVMLARRRKKITQDELAQRVGVSRQTISSIERGVAKPSHQIVIAVCTVLAINEPVLLAVERGEV